MPGMILKIHSRTTQHLRYMNMGTGQVLLSSPSSPKIGSCINLVETVQTSRKRHHDVNSISIRSVSSLPVVRTQIRVILTLYNIIGALPSIRMRLT